MRKRGSYRSKNKTGGKSAKLSTGKNRLPLDGLKIKPIIAEGVDLKEIIY